ncbi:MAG: peptidoglycan bridge formation glycyltransferase FemA/FemB family protein [Parcubacteria group bacterium]|jgi:lipid II:glycine glycyltransferase (peptidoglycan interpeptide bridge formation enzyme)
MENINEFIQKNSPDGGFLQSEQWRKFQEATGKKTFNVSGENFWANIVEHRLPLVGKYLYIPRGPICHPERTLSEQSESKGESKDLIQVDSSVASRGETSLGMTKLVDLAKQEKAGWIRFDANDSLTLDIIRENWRVVKAPHDMQPKEVFVIDINKNEEDLLSGMKSKTRYNIKLAEKKGVSVRAITKIQDTITKQKTNSNIQNTNYFNEFLRLVKVTAKRDGITPHPDSHYQKMFTTIPDKNLKLYVAEYENKIIAANLVVFYGDTATYLHGASDNENRNVMAPFLLQWRQIQDAKKSGCTRYDFGGVSTIGNKDWAGITKFKTGFSPNTQPLEFPGSFDIVLSPMKYNAYRIIQKLKSLL